MLHEFTPTDAGNATLAERNEARQKSLTKLAREIKEWTDRKKIKQFQKYEVMNLKTYKCRNKNNISPIVTIEYDPKKMNKNNDTLYEPRVQAYQAIKMHLDNVEQASSQWLHNKSLNAMENIMGSDEEQDSVRQ